MNDALAQDYRVVLHALKLPGGSHAVKMDFRFQLLIAVGRATDALGLRMERIDTLVARLDEDGMTVRCLVRLIPAVIAKNQGYGNRTDLDADTGRACKRAWQKFVAERRDALKQGKRFELTDPNFPLVHLFPSFTFESPR